MDKLKIYVHSFEIPPIGFVDKEGAAHACARAQKTWSKGLERASGLLGSSYLSDDERKALAQVESFCNNCDLEFEVVDLARVNFWTRLKWWMKQLHTPSISYKKKIFHGIPTAGDIKQLVKE